MKQNKIAIESLIHYRNKIKLLQLIPHENPKPLVWVIKQGSFTYVLSKDINGDTPAMVLDTISDLGETSQNLTLGELYDFLIDRVSEQVAGK